MDQSVACDSLCVFDNKKISVNNSKKIKGSLLELNVYVLRYLHISASISCSKRERKVKKMPRLTDNPRYEAVGMLLSISTVAVARHFNIHKLTIHWLSQRLAQNDTVVDSWGSGRPRATSDAGNKFIRTRYLIERFTTASDTSRQWNGSNNVSEYTVTS